MPEGSRRQRTRHPFFNQQTAAFPEPARFHHECRVRGLPPPAVRAIRRCTSTGGANGGRGQAPHPTAQPVQLFNWALQRPVVHCRGRFSGGNDAHGSECEKPASGIGKPASGMTRTGSETKNLPPETMNVPPETKTCLWKRRARLATRRFRVEKGRHDSVRAGHGRRG